MTHFHVQHLHIPKNKSPLILLNLNIVKDLSEPVRLCKNNKISLFHGYV